MAFPATGRTKPKVGIRCLAHLPRVAQFAARGTAFQLALLAGGEVDGHFRARQTP
ncbi:hypothetical protein FB474_3081 [Oryzihumus leptocrescens]|uniref:Uncharacterized protein n=1 Tax=Oryzihumus leptocrescens TaxID=297536 RepID=A0A542ZMZ4_9MICO|nr:hypothetical protein FB474_3081 [Oryzihumus leptocrescens]